MAGVSPEPPAAFSALATTRSSSSLGDQAGDGAADDVAPRFADDVADEEDVAWECSSRSGEPSRTHCALPFVPLGSRHLLTSPFP